MKGAVLTSGNKRKRDRCALDTAEFDLGLLCRLCQALQRLAIPAQIDLVFLLEGVGQPINNAAIPIVSAELRVSTRGLDVKDPLSNAQD